MKAKDTICDSPIELLTNLMNTPLGIDVCPEFSWVLQSKENNNYQTAYRIILSDNKDDIENNNGNTWDSGKIISGKSANVPYTGNVLNYESVYYWKVQTFDKSDIASSFSDYQKISTAVGHNWKAVPIWDTAADMMFLRKEFILKKTPESVIASVFADSAEKSRQYIFELRVNGKFIGLGPVKSHNNKFFYNTYDITENIKEGTNCLGAICFTQLNKVFLLQLKIVYKDGTTETIITDDSWKSMDAKKVYGMTRSIGTVLYFAPSEDIDARKFPYCFDMPGFDDSDFVPVIQKTYDFSNLHPNYTEKVDKFYNNAQSVIKTAENSYLADIGREVIGGLKIKLKVPEKYEGTTLRILYGEEMEDETNVKYKLRTSNVYEEFWTLKSGDQEIESFGMKAYRYLNILNCPFDIACENIQSVSYRQHFNKNESFFESSNSLLNDIYDYVKYSIMVTSQDLYVDSQTRERKNYEGDALINQLSQYCLHKNFTLPRFSSEDLYYNHTWPFEYKQMSVMMAWYDYMYTGNINSLKDNYDKIRTKTATTNDDPTNGLDYNLGLIFNGTKSNGDNANLVDWPMSERDSYDFTNAYYNTVTNSFHYKAYICLANIAHVLGKADDEKLFSENAKIIKNAMITKLINKETGLFTDGLDKDGNQLSHSSQHANIFPVALGVVDDDKTKKIILDSVYEKGMCTSVYGAMFVLTACYAADNGKTAFKLLSSRSLRSWYHLIYELGSTVCAEAWDPKNKPNMTFSHPWSSAPANIIVRGMFGIKPVTPGFSEFDIKLQPGDLSYAKIKTPTIKGSIEVVYDINRLNESNAVICVNATIPVNTLANIYIPVTDEKQILLIDGKQEVIKPEKGYCVIRHMGSGTHNIMLK